MDERAIVFDWLGQTVNRDKLPTISATKEISNFIIANMDCMYFIDAMVYKVGNKYYKLHVTDNQ